MDHVEDGIRSAEELERSVSAILRRYDPQVNHLRQPIRDPVQEKLQQIGPSVRAGSYLLERMFPRFTERLGTALDLFVEFSTLGEYGLGASPAPRPTSAQPAAVSPARGLGGADPRVGRSSERRPSVGVVGCVPAATPSGRRRRPAPAPPEQACKAAG